MRASDVNVRVLLLLALLSAGQTCCTQAVTREAVPSALAAILAKGAADTMQRATVPADGCIRIVDYGYRDWGPELVHYTVDGRQFPPGSLTLLDGNGSAVPFQIDGDVLTFVAALPKGGTALYRLHTTAQKTSPAAGALTADSGNESFEIRNEFLAVRMPPPGSRRYDPPVDAASVPAPLLGWRIGGHGWIGGGHFSTKRRVASTAFSVVRQGPAVVEYEARYRFAPQGEYVCRIRLSPGMPIAVVTEEFDMGEVTHGEDALVLDLHRGWQPRYIGWIPYGGEQQMPALKGEDYSSYLQSRRSARPVAPPVGGVGEQPAPHSPGPDACFLGPISPGNPWGPNKGGVQVWDGASPATGDSVGLVPLSLGSWRRAMVLDCWHREGTGAAVSLPIGVRLASWALDVTDDRSPFSTHEHDPGLKATYGRRVWGLYTGPELVGARIRFGYIGLDRYKDWIIDYPEGPAAKTAYPGALFRPELLRRLRAAIDGHPQADQLRRRYLISGKVEDAIANAHEVIDRLKRPYQQNDFELLGLSNYRKVQLLMFANRAEDALACPDLPPDLRQELRRRLVLYAYVASEPDWNPRGVGTHLGNNNMPINRASALSLFAPQLPDHPRYAYWMDQIRDCTSYKLASQTAVDGVDIECPTYHLYAPAQGINISLNALRNRGVDTSELLDRFKAKLTWLANLTMPDPRYGGQRIIPGMGNSSNLRESIWGVTVATFAQTDPEFAGWLSFMFDLAGRHIGADSTGVTSVGHAMYYLPDQPKNPKALGTAFFPTYGVVFRNHFNTPNETAMLLRAGMNWGHWDTDALNVILYGKGAPLSPGTGYQYYSGPTVEHNAVYHNQVKVGRRDTQECFGRVDAAVADYGFGPIADYAVASRFIPSQVFRDGKGPATWNRHVLFLKSSLPAGEDYFVMRDTFTGDVRQTWWTWLNLDAADLVSVDGAAFDPAKTAADKNVPEEQFQRLTGRTLEMRTRYGASTWFWFSEPRTVQTRMTFKAAGETKTIVEVPGAPGQDLLYVVYPRKDGAPTPACRTPAPGVVEITTAESRDVVFLGDVPFTWERDGITFTGKAGAVRVFADRVSLCMSAGSGRVGYQGCILEGHGPFQREIRLAELRAGVRRVTDGYQKKTLTVDLGRGVQVSGEGPFTAKLDGETVRIRVQGRARVLHVTQPPFILRPQYFIDGKEWMACWTDYPNNGWGSYDRTWLIGLSVPAGEHELVVKEYAFPKGWTRPFTPLIKGAIINE